MRRNQNTMARRARPRNRSMCCLGSVCNRAQKARRAAKVNVLLKNRNDRLEMLALSGEVNVSKG